MSISYVQSTTSRLGNSAATRTVTFTSDVSAGSLLVVAVHSNSAGGVTLAVTLPPDSQGNPYSQAGSYSRATLGARELMTTVFYAPNAIGGPCTVSVAVSDTTYTSVSIHEYKGLDASSPLASSANSQAAFNSTAIPTGTATVATPGQLVFAFCGIESTSDGVPTVPSPFTIREAVASLAVDPFVGCGTADHITASSNESVTFTVPTAVNCTTVIASFTPAPFVPNTVARPPFYVRGQGPPIPGPYFLARPNPFGSGPASAPPAPPAAPSSNMPFYGTGRGPFLRGAPWSRILPITPPQPPRPPGPPTPPPQPGRGQNRPFLERVPVPPRADATPDQMQEFYRRLTRHTDKLSFLWNSLVAQGILVQTDPSQWTVRGSGFTEARAPLPTDDITQGVVVLMSWLNTVTGDIYVCTSNAKNLATWKKLS